MEAVRGDAEDFGMEGTRTMLDPNRLEWINVTISHCALDGKRELNNQP